MMNVSKGTALAFVTIATVNCRSGEGADLVQRERLSVITWTLPPKGSMSSGGELHRHDRFAEASWEIALPQAWAEYRDWSQAAAPAGYKRTRIADDYLSFARRSAGDQFLVELRVVATGPPLTVRVTFMALPD